MSVRGDGARGATGDPAVTPEALAALHARCFTVPRPFSAGEFAELLGAASCFLVADGQGFALGRASAGEAELLTIAVDPAHRRAGLGGSLLRGFHREAATRGAARAFLEVAADNAAALGLYRAAGYDECGRRKGYYRHPGGRRVDALLMERALAPE